MLIMSEDAESTTLTDDQLKELCAQLGLKTTKKQLLLVAKLVKRVGGTDVKKLSVALKKAMIDT